MIAFLLMVACDQVGGPEPGTDDTVWVGGEVPELGLTAAVTEGPDTEVSLATVTTLAASDPDGDLVSWGFGDPWGDWTEGELEPTGDYVATVPGAVDVCDRGRTFGWTAVVGDRAGHQVTATVAATVPGEVWEVPEVGDGEADVATRGSLPEDGPLAVCGELRADAGEADAFGVSLPTPAPWAYVVFTFAARSQVGRVSVSVSGYASEEDVGDEVVSVAVPAEPGGALVASVSSDGAGEYVVTVRGTDGG